MDKIDRKVRRQDFFNRFSKTKLRASRGWKMGDDILILKNNNTFRYYTTVLLSKTNFYSGTFKVFNDSISFDFNENHKPSLFIKSDTLVFDRKNQWNVLRNSKVELNERNYLIVYENKIH